MTPILPPALREGAAKLIEKIAQTEIARRSAALTDAYRGGAGSAHAIASEADVAAYLAARMPATYAAMASALAAVRVHAAAFAPETLLDIGAGPGTASWAAVETWPGIASVAMLEPQQQLRDASRTLCADANQTALRNARAVAGGIAALDPSERYDLVVAGYVVAELGDVALARAVDVLWNACTGILVIVEPGTPQGFARILAARGRLLELGARIVAPCPGAYACPVAGWDWCHFSVRLPRSRAHLRAKGASVPFEDERFSYLAIARDTVRISLPPARIVSEPKASKPGVSLRLCSDGKIAERMIPRRDKPQYKRAAKLKWGEAI